MSTDEKKTVPVLEISTLLFFCCSIALLMLRF